MQIENKNWQKLLILFVRYLIVLIKSNQLWEGLSWFASLKVGVIG